MRCEGVYFLCMVDSYHDRMVVFSDHRDRNGQNKLVDPI